jgi:hypothetical protein
MDSHAAEYAGAIAGMTETYGTRRAADTYAIGDHVNFRLSHWSARSYEDGQVISHNNGKLIVQTAGDIVEVDPRPWPEGNVLPF